MKFSFHPKLLDTLPGYGRAAATSGSLPMDR